jgi:hypothetical protein
MSDNDATAAYEIETDGRTVWLNAPTCVARFCPISAEIFAGATTEVRAVRGTDALTQRATWLWFSARVSELFGVSLGNKHAPEWMRSGGVIGGRGASNINVWDVCACEHYRAEHTGFSGHCEVIVIHGGRERDRVCRAFRFMRRRRI